MAEQKLRILFMGTPVFAVESLKALLNAGMNIVGVITAPDKPAGRGKKILSSPVKLFAQENGINTILQPTNLKDSLFADQLKELQADLQVVVAFRMLPEVVWSMPPQGTVNLHASLLPDYRGAAPINWAIINGEKQTGVSTFFIEKEIDTGKIIYSERVAITENMNAGELHDKLMLAGAKLLVRTVEAIADGNSQSTAQAELSGSKQLNTAPKIFKEDCRINWNHPGWRTHDFIRGLSPYPAAWTEIENGTDLYSVKIFKAEFLPIEHETTVGKILSDNSKYIKVAVMDGFINILSLQLAGKKRLDTEDFLRGFNCISDYRIV